MMLRTSGRGLGPFLHLVSDDLAADLEAHLGAEAGKRLREADFERVAVALDGKPQLERNDGGATFDGDRFQHICRNEIRLEIRVDVALEHLSNVLF